jgi:hypothetical protein
MTGPAPLGPPPGRYGPVRTADPTRRRALLWGLGAVGLTGAVWLGLGAAATPVTWQDVGFTLADGEVEVVYDVSRPDPSVPVRCTLEALSHSYAQVGVVDVDVPPSDERTVRQVSTVRVAEPAVTGVVKYCWVVED